MGGYHRQAARSQQSHRRVANTLARVIWAVWFRDQDYDPAAGDPIAA